MQVDHRLMVANSRYIKYIADFLGREKYCFVKQHHKQMMPEPLQSHPSVSSFYTIYAAFHVFEFRKEDLTGVHNVDVFSFISIYMYFFDFFSRNV